MVLWVHLGVFLIRKQFLGGNFAVQQAEVFALGNTEGRYHCVNQFERGLGLVAENHHPFVEFFLVVIASICAPLCSTCPFSFFFGPMRHEETVVAMPE